MLRLRVRGRRWSSRDHQRVGGQIKLQVDALLHGGDPHHLVAWLHGCAVSVRTSGPDSFHDYRALSLRHASRSPPLDFHRIVNERYDERCLGLRHHRRKHPCCAFGGLVLLLQGAGASSAHTHLRERQQAHLANVQVCDGLLQRLRVASDISQLRATILDPADVLAAL